MRVRLALLPLAAMLYAGGASGGADQCTFDLDPLHARVRAELSIFQNWLKSAGAPGLIGELGWPTIDARWNTLAESYFADAGDLWTTYWSTGRFWKSTYPLDAYQRLTSPSQQAAVIGASPS